MSRYYALEECCAGCWYETDYHRFKDLGKAIKAYKKEYSEPSIYRYRIVHHETEVVVLPKRRVK